MNVIETRADGWARRNADGQVTIFSCPVGFCSDDSSVCSANRKPDSLLCGECSDGYSEWGGECVECSSANGGVIVAMVIVAIVLVLVIHRSSQRTTSALLKVFMYFYATASFMLDAAYSSNHLSWLRVLNLDVMNSSGQCVAPLDAYSQLVLKLLEPFVLCAIILIVAVAVKPCARWSRRKKMSSRHSVDHGKSALPMGAYAGHGENDSDADGDREGGIGGKHSASFRSENHEKMFGLAAVTRTLLALFIFGYTNLATTSLRMLTCTNVGDERVVYYHPTMDCRSTWYSRYSVISIMFLIVFVIAAPLAILLLLRKYRDRLWSEQMRPYVGVCTKCTRTAGTGTSPSFSCAEPPWSSSTWHFSTTG